MVRQMSWKVCNVANGNGDASQAANCSQVCRLIPLYFFFKCSHFHCTSLSVLIDHIHWKTMHLKRERFEFISWTITVVVLTDAWTVELLIDDAHWSLVRRYSQMDMLAIHPMRDCWSVERDLICVCAKVIALVWFFIVWYYTTLFGVMTMLHDTKQGLFPKINALAHP